jgi:hypothetical protein
LVEEGSKKLVGYYGGGPTVAVAVKKAEGKSADEKPAEEETKSDGEEVEF